ncbi:FliO/MopB family protein [Amnibacterium endophyticum]|uniref:FliO/MopB family protein n=1 Tax=Amnibacterium endophyticum TaxID=2109337 RepID=A0ABW4LEK5_9MICO
MDFDTVILALRVVVGLGAVFGALLLLHRWVTKRQLGGSGRERQIAVVARQGLGAKAGVAVVEAGGRRYLLGVTEHAVTVLDTLGAAPDAVEPRLVSTQPVTVARFEQELRTVTISTGDVPVLVHGAADAPHGPVTQTLAITRADAPVPATRRALREAEQRRTQAQGGPLAGSVLSPATWKQTRDALRRAR